MERVEGTPVKFVVTKKFVYGDKTFRPGEVLNWDIRSFEELQLTNDENIIEIEMTKKDWERELEEKVNYMDRVEGMPIRFVVTKPIFYRGKAYKKGQVLDWPKTTYEELAESFPIHTHIIEMTKENWKEELEEKTKLLNNRITKIEDKSGEVIPYHPILEILHTEDAIGKRKGGLITDYYELQEIEKIVNIFEERTNTLDRLSNKPKNETKGKTFIKKRSSN